MTKIERCYDSHLHLMATGEAESGLKLFDLKNPEDLKHIKLEKNYFRGEWLVGFGWNQFLFPDEKYPTAKHLDQIFPDFPVALTRADGHASWLNSAALKKTGYFQVSKKQRPDPQGGLILRDENGFPTGVFIDLAKIAVDQLIPQPSLLQKKDFLISAIQKLNSRGFTHARDMSSSLEQWQLLKDLENENKLTLYIDQNFTCENLQDFKRALSEAKEARAKATSHLRVAGIKVYLDGALGSEGAYLSQNYAHSKNRGLVLWSEADLVSVIQQTWAENFDISIHGIGDAAASLIANSAWKVWQSGLQGRLNLEHGQLLQNESIQILQKMKVRVYMQPCHFLSDRLWLKQKLGDLYHCAFPWEELRKAGIDLRWGSDTPIEEPNLFSNREALLLSVQEGIPAYLGDWWRPHQHPDPSWGANCVTEISDTQVIATIFDSKKLV